MPTILQFGAGNFLRAFVDVMVQHANDAGVTNERIAVVLATPRHAAAGQALAQQGGRYRVILDGPSSREITEVTCIESVIHAHDSFAVYRAAYLAPELRVIVSNTTEAGIVWDGKDSLDAQPPLSFPAKIAALLHDRFVEFRGDPGAGLHIVCCELIEDNAATLRELVERHAAGLSPEFHVWLREHCHFHNSLVDRIVTGYPGDELAGEDRCAVAGELYGQWVIEDDGTLEALLPLHLAGQPVTFTRNVAAAREEKVLILNGIHTALSMLGPQFGHTTVQEAITDPRLRAFVDRLLAGEILPALPAKRRAEAEEFAAATLARFDNPALEHRLSDIALNASSKWLARNYPAFRTATADGREAPGTALVLAVLILSYWGDPALPYTIEPRDEADVIESIRRAGTFLHIGDAVAESLRAIGLPNDPALADAVGHHITQIRTLGLDSVTHA